MRKTLTDRAVAALKTKAKRYTVSDPDMRGMYVRITPSGQKSFVVVAPNPRTRKQVWAVIGDAAVLSIADARERAREAIRRIKDGLAAFEQPPVPPASFQHVAGQWMQRHVRAKGLRTEGRIDNLLQAHMYPRWGKLAFVDIKRSDVSMLLDVVEDGHGARTADYCLAIISGIAHWFAGRDDSYVPPLARSMRRTNPRERARSRILADDELQALWAATEDGSAFSAFVRVLLLTAQRRHKVVTMRWCDIDQHGVWKIPTEPREKNVPTELVLPGAARAIIAAQPRMGANPFVFAGQGDSNPMSGISDGKAALDARMPRDTPAFVLHDLRRTARSLMSRAGVLRDHAERALGHTIPGVEGVYDRHRYRDEIGSALAKLAGLIERIVNPPADVVVPMAKRARTKM